MHVDLELQCLCLLLDANSLLFNIYPGLNDKISVKVYKPKSSHGFRSVLDYALKYNIPQHYAENHATNDVNWYLISTVYRI